MRFAIGDHVRAAGEAYYVLARLEQFAAPDLYCLVDARRSPVWAEDADIEPYHPRPAADGHQADDA